MRTNILSRETAPAGGSRTLRDVLPALALPMAAAYRVAFDRRCPAFLARYVGTEDIRIGLRATGQAGLRLELTSYAGELSVEFDAAADPAWSTIERLARMPGQERVACDVATEVLRGLARKRNVNDLGLQVAGIKSAGALTDTGHAGLFPPSIAIDGHELQVLWMDASFGLFASDEMRTEHVRKPAALAALRLPCKVAFGHRHLGMETVASLQPGDVVLAGRSPLAVKWLIGSDAGVCAPGRMDDAMQVVTLDRAPAVTGDMSMEIGEGPLDNLELPLQFEIETTRLSLTEISALGPGHVIALEMPVDQAKVKLRCHGQLVGLGKLIVVGEQLGVCIETMNVKGSDVSDR